ncbi:MAG TPA: PEGA domain-containing protein, partial [Kofleriaceae bacterium]|nr:PEGA domain-containing protein [Kofleriaceae bacterium]
ATTATVKFTVTPAAADAVVMVDGKKVGDSLEVALKGGKKSIKVTAKADGYHSFSQTVTVTGDTEVPIRLAKRSSTPLRGSHGGTGPGNKIDL